MKKYLCMDVGGTFVKYALITEDGEMLEHDKTPTILTSRDAFFASVFDVIDRYKEQIEGIGFCMPGRIDYLTGYAYTAGACSEILGNCPVGEILREHTGLPVTVGNDAKCAAAAEAWSGSLKDAENGAVIVIGTGIGGGIIINHKVFMGTHFVAGELSDLIYDNEALVNGFDAKEGMEWRKEHPSEPIPEEYLSPIYSKYASTTSLLMMYAKRKGIKDYRTVSGEEVFSALRQGDADAKEAVRILAYRIASEIVSIQAVIDVQRVAIGGGIMAAPELFPAIEDALHDVFKRFDPSFPCIEPEIVPCQYGNDANLLGALKLHLDH